MAKKLKKKAFDGICTGIQMIDGSAMMFDKTGAPSVIFSIVNPVQQLCTDMREYCAFHDVLANIIQTLGEGYALQKQDIFCRQKYHRDMPTNAEFLSRSYFEYFEGREYTEIKTYLIITQEPQKNLFVKFDAKKWEEFTTKIAKIQDILSDKNITYHKLSEKEIEEYLKRFLVFNFRKEPISVNNFSTSEKGVRIDDKIIRSFPIVDIDFVNLPSLLSPYTSFTVNGHQISTDLLNFLPSIPHADCVIYNQLIQIPAQRPLISKLNTKSNRHGSFSASPGNLKAKEDIDTVLAILSTDSKLLANTNFNIMVSCPEEKLTEISSFLETRFFELNITPSKSAYNQYELYIASFPGNGYAMNPEYDLFLTQTDAALCLCFKEHLKTDENTELTTFYTDRQGLPVCIDFTGKEGKVKMTDNANFFCLGPSGSGKSFHMNSVVRQLREQDTDIVMVDTGDSYEGICAYFNGVYISYSKEHPISMNPFKVTIEEYNLNFGEKKNFLKSLIFLIYKKNEEPTMIEDMVISNVIDDYYKEYFNPFYEFDDIERESLRKKLLLNLKMNDSFEKISDSLDDIEELIQKEPGKIEHKSALLLPSEERRQKLIRQCQIFNQIIKDEGATEEEKKNAIKKLEDHKAELHETSHLVDIDKKIKIIETNRRKLKVNELSFNTFYEFALERIPQITSFHKILFEIRDFAAILSKFYKGGEFQETLNSDLDVNLFEEKFIVFEIDKIKDNPVLFPIVVLIIMDVFLQKMRIKKGRKALIIEEAWKAIATPTMAEYIKYLYKTVRKFHGIAGIVTQELNDVISSPIVKEAIINNSDVKVLLDQNKFKDRYDDISKILGLTEIQKQQIFTINSLQNKEGRNYFKEVWICRGLISDVYGVEEPPECYWAYTTERAEKEARNVYLDYYKNIQDAITNLEKDRKKLKIQRYLDFANIVNKADKEARSIYFDYYPDEKTALEHLEEDRKKSNIKNYLDFTNQVNKQKKVMSLWSA